MEDKTNLFSNNGDTKNGINKYVEYLEDVEKYKIRYDYYNDELNEYKEIFMNNPTLRRVYVTLSERDIYVSPEILKLWSQLEPDWLEIFQSFLIVEMQRRKVSGVFEDLSHSEVYKMLTNIRILSQMSFDWKLEKEYRLKEEKLEEGSEEYWETVEKVADILESKKVFKEELIRSIGK